MRLANFRCLTPALIACLTLAASFQARPAAAEEPAPAALEVGQTVRGQTNGEEPLKYRFTFPESGALSIIVRCTQDISIQAIDRFGRDLLMGAGDMDFAGQIGHEQVILTGQRDQTVDLEIHCWDEGGAPFTLVSGFIEIEDLEIAHDPAGNPDESKELFLGHEEQESLMVDAGDQEDWFHFTAPRSGRMCVYTDGVATPPQAGGEGGEDADAQAQAQAEAQAQRMLRDFGGFDGMMNDGISGDITMEVYDKDQFRDYIAYSDQDTQGEGCRESVVLQVAAGATYYFRVTAYQASKYSICVTMLEAAPGMAQR